MRSLVLIDTDVLINLAHGDRKTIAQVDLLKNERILATTIISQMEMVVGCRDNHELHTLGRFLSRFRIMALSESAGGIAADLLQKFHLSHGLAIPDALIAGIAIAEHLPLLTGNRRHYQFIEELELFLET